MTLKLSLVLISRFRIGYKVKHKTRDVILDRIESTIH